MQSGLSLLDKTHKIHTNFQSNPQKTKPKEPEKLLDMESTKNLV